MTDHRTNRQNDRKDLPIKSPRRRLKNMNEFYIQYMRMTRILTCNTPFQDFPKILYMKTMTDEIVSMFIGNAKNNRDMGTRVQYLFLFPGNKK